MGMLINRKLKPLWRHRCPRDRFGYEQVADGTWQLVDWQYGLTLMVGNGKHHEQIKAGWFAKNYVRIHGDIDLRSFPYSLDQELHYDGEKPAEVRRQL